MSTKVGWARLSRTQDSGVTSSLQSELNRFRFISRIAGRSRESATHSRSNQDGVHQPWLCEDSHKPTTVATRDWRPHSPKTCFQARRPWEMKEVRPVPTPDGRFRPARFPRSLGAKERRRLKPKDMPVSISSAWALGKASLAPGSHSSRAEKGVRSLKSLFGL